VFHDDQVPGPVTADPHAYVWLDPIVYRRLHEESAAAWLGTIDHLAEHGGVAPALLDEAERLVAEAEAQDPEVFSQTWAHPLCFAWSFALYEAAERRDEAALGAALHQLHLVAAASALARGDDIAFTCPVPLRTLTVLPGQPCVLAAPAGTHLGGVRAGRLVLARGGQRTALAVEEPGEALGARLYLRPRIRIGALQVDLLPEALLAPETGLGESGAALSLEDGFQEEHTQLARRALELVQRHQPTTFDQMVHHLRVIALKRLADGDYTNVSVSEAPGAFVASVYAHPYEMADIFIHEFHHNRLFGLENIEPLIDLEDTWRGYSPWRDDPRPLRGLLHAVYVFQPVARYWGAVAASGEAKGDLGDYARDQVVRTALQLRTAFDTLDAHATWTAHGAIARPVLEAGVAEAAERARTLGLTPDLPAWRLDPEGRLARDRDRTVAASVAAHRAAYDQRNA
jgi:HEXXH motif-containing protein